MTRVVVRVAAAREAGEGMVVRAEGGGGGGEGGGEGDGGEGG